MTFAGAKPADGEMAGCREASAVRGGDKAFEIVLVLSWTPWTAGVPGARGFTAEAHFLQALPSLSPSRGTRSSSQLFREHLMDQMKPRYMTREPFKTEEENTCFLVLLSQSLEERLACKFLCLEH